ncbi:MAG: hypothetical protein QGF28_00175 [Candidatus Thalassarchaeaceae archaeon]|jgi:hypothetical protein|nr:hypothetical protein [Euryarchaeota archaeon]MDP7091609.1 hypothetical protein [Candidatus Thalassarchaeaceae archaeon]MBV43581.1 hypothetical protein [Euryarchaeota archaeon]MDP7257729.1 hypothetical protein [Candidatus Thalassarchaeaceae archaeon]MDP7445611.1 hypothetical protein [Candidatus Thalassarchaeaceae archaeon]|tara:strand:- start:147 stop:827 length:681 start_codon:yes stop_codon:yes gene_type:complete
MPRVIHIDGVDDGFRDALIDRLQRAGADFAEDRGEADVTIGLGGGASGDIVIIPRNAPHGDAKLVVRVHDLILPSDGRGWGTEILRDWVEGIKREEAEEHHGDTKASYWVHVRDVVDAMTILIMEEGGMTANGTIDVCGRRAWADKDVIDEIGLLWQRYLNAVHHSHTVESLAGVPSPVREGAPNPSHRPDLGPLHEAIIEAGGDGWHPIVPMRTALMELIALSSE